MHQPMFALVWRGTSYRFHRLRQSTTQPGSAEWAVGRAGDFVGLMPCPDHLSPQEFGAHCLRWIGELTGTAAGTPG